MARTIKRIAHDLTPLSDAATELSAIIFQQLMAIKSHIAFDNPKALKYFDESSRASEMLAVSIKLIREYIREINSEADNEKILKD